MSFVKKHKFKLIISLFFLLLFVFIFFTIADWIFPNTQKDFYGNRLAGMQEVRIDSSKMDAMKAIFMENEEVVDSSIILKGRILNFHLYVTPTADKLTMQTLGDKAVDLLDDNQKSYYDVQIFIMSKEESEQYPIIGYKHKTSLQFKWSKQE